jgi:predicted nucleic acid-binding protein
MSSNGIRPYISTQSIVDAAYIMSHTYKYDISRFKDSVRMINGNFNIVSITAEDIIAASGSPIEDFEDAAQVSCAGRHGCRAILSADANLKKCSPIPVFTPEEFIAKLTGGN